MAMTPPRHHRFLLLAVLGLALASGCADPSDAPQEVGLEDPAEAVPADKPNSWLVCPPDTCAVEPDAASPVYAVSADALARAFLAVAEAQPRTEVVEADPGRRLYLLRQRSAVFGFPDLISVGFRETGPDESTLIVFSRSVYGYWDLGVNRRRVEAWLGALDAALDG
jgi:uncharacterized protein (DUF1499 family)